MENSQSEITAVGIGTAGCRIVSLLTRRSLIVDRSLYISCEKGDLADLPTSDSILVESPIDQKLTPSLARGLAMQSSEKIREALSGSKVVFVVAGLGRATGSGLAPLVAALCDQVGATPVGVAVMPLEYEKKLKFYAGISLRRFRAASRGVIVIDNDTLMRSSPDDSTLANIYDSANDAAVKALASLLSRSSDLSIPVGLNKVLGAVLQDGYSLLGVSSSSTSDKAEDALAGAVVSLGKMAQTKEASHAVVVLDGDSSLSAQEVGVAVKRLGSMMNNEYVDVEYGVDYSGSSQLQVSVLATGFKSTKYDDYDPLAAVLGDRVLDEEMDSSVYGGLDGLQSCE